jgi:hypothetical protein
VDPILVAECDEPRAIGRRETLWCKRPSFCSRKAWHRGVFANMRREPSTHTSQLLLETAQIVRRECTHCDWEAQFVEDDDADPICPVCSSPTKRASVLGLIVPTRVSLGQKNPLAVKVGLLGAAKGGNARAQALSPRRRRSIARKAALARWSRQAKPRKPRGTP